MISAIYAHENMTIYSLMYLVTPIISFCRSVLQTDEIPHPGVIFQPDGLDYVVPL